MLSDEKLAAHLHYWMSLIGGFFGAYALLNRCDILGCAQTSNLLSLILDLLGGDLFGVFLRVIALLIYAAAIVLSIALTKYARVDLRIVSISCTAVASVLLGFFPEDMNNMIGLYPIFFISALQWTAFQGAFGFSSATIFSTNNFRQFITGITEYMFSKEKDARKKASFYGYTLLSFHLGAAISFFAYRLFSVRGSFLCIVPLTVAFFYVKRAANERVPARFLPKVRSELEAVCEEIRQEEGTISVMSTVDGR